MALAIENELKVISGEAQSRHLKRESTTSKIDSWTMSGLPKIFSNFQGITRPPVIMQICVQVVFSWHLRKMNLIPQPPPPLLVRGRKSWDYLGHL